MRTIKLVVIGASGVGKTSLRNQYISGRFTTGYRATIGADFITKTITHHVNVDEKVTLQIWDTAGQERFSSLSSAFFRGADAVMLMFDVNQPQTLEALSKWWTEFKHHAPVPDEEVNRFCCVFVGNKIDLPIPTGTMNSTTEGRVSESRAVHFIDNLIPPPTESLLDTETPTRNLSLLTHVESDDADITFNILTPSPHTHSIDIAVYHPHHKHPRRKASRSRSRSTLFHSGTVGTMATSHSALSVYHTPRSSIFDTFESARSSPTPRSTRSSYSNFSSPSSSRSPSRSPVQSIRRQHSLSSLASDSLTITPSLFVERHLPPETTCTTPSPAHTLPILPTLEHGTKLFFTSAKTGEGVQDVFEYVARRVVTRWEYEESIEARTLHMTEASIDGAIRLRSAPDDGRRWQASTCCGS